MLEDRGDSLKGKRVMITGSGRTARSVAKKLLEYGAIPIAFSDTSGHVYEPGGFPDGKLAMLNKIKVGGDSLPSDKELEALKKRKWSLVQ